MILEGVDKSGNLFGTIMYPHGEEAADLGLHLVQAGLAKVSPRASMPVSCVSGGHVPGALYDHVKALMCGMHPDGVHKWGCQGLI